MRNTLHSTFTDLYTADSKSKMITRRLGGGDEAYYTRVTFRSYVEEADDEANKGSALI